MRRPQKGSLFPSRVGLRRAGREAVCWTPGQGRDGMQEAEVDSVPRAFPSGSPGCRFQED